jgi:hypothetical protein
MLLRQLPNPQQPCLTGPSPPCTISFVTTAPTSRCAPQPSSAATSRSKSLTYASTSWNLSMMTSTLPPAPHLLREHRRPEETSRCSHCPPCSCACSCSQSGHRPRFDFNPAGCYPRRSPSPTPPPAPAPAPVPDPVLPKKVQTLTQQVAALVARPAALPRPSKTQQPAPQQTKARATKSAPTRSPTTAAPAATDSLSMHPTGSTPSATGDRGRPSRFSFLSLNPSPSRS